MYIEAVIVCVDYSDFLAHTLPHNKTYFDKLVVVTSLKDESTKRLCEHLNVECIQTDVFYEGGDKFNKGKGINAGLEVLSKKEWVVHLDADIWLPPLTRSILEKVVLDPFSIYGIDRMMCPTFEAWNNYITNPKPIHEGWIYVHPTAFPMGVRIAEYKSEGWEPIGYFQMWYPKITLKFTYPEHHGEADRTDVLFCKQWPRVRRILIPEIIAIHLDSEDIAISDMGKNWRGRVSKPFSLNPCDEIILDKKEECKLTPPRRYKLPWWWNAWFCIQRLFSWF